MFDHTSARCYLRCSTGSRRLPRRRNPIARFEVSLREYELTVVYDLSVAEAGGNDAAPNHVDTLVAARGGTVLRHDHWGRRRMAYPINRAIDADYVVSRIEIDPTEVTPLEAAMRIDERIYRHLIVRADELPVPPPPREPRVPRPEPGDATASTEASAATAAPDEAAPAATVAAEAAVAAPSPVVEPEQASAAVAEPVVAPVEAAAVEPAAAEAAEPIAAEGPEVASPATEAPAAAVESAPTEAEATAEAGTEDEAPSA